MCKLLELSHILKGAAAYPWTPLGSSQGKNLFHPNRSLYPWWLSLSSKHLKSFPLSGKCILILLCEKGRQVGSKLALGILVCSSSSGSLDCRMRESEKTEVDLCIFMSQPRSFTRTHPRFPLHFAKTFAVLPGCSSLPYRKIVQTLYIANFYLL